MEQLGAGDLVTVATSGPEIDGIVFDLPSPTKAIVALMDRRRGPVLRAVARTALTERTGAGADDAAFRLLIRRTPAAGHSAAKSVPGAGRGSSGHGRGAAHRSTGR
jgi:hypothetical protein